ncbi:MAPEG family protein [Sphingomonas sp. ID0503]|uniref:MAPEG family protein n=1 Tax=Sphingomonas sp. ID0503 TaxID=3399691 RepID=UPI003AFB1788
MLPTVTLIIAAALAIINLWLAMRIVPFRMKGVPVGDGGNPLIVARMRAQSNFAEYVPVALILMALVELHVGADGKLWGIGAALAIGRVLHPFGIERPVPNVMRAGGILLTWVATLLLALWAVLIGFGVTGGVASVTYL